MSSTERCVPTSMPEVSRYLSVDPQTLGQLRILTIGDVELQLDSHRHIVRGTPVHLPHKEFVILQQVHISRLRAKIESDMGRPTYIRTVHGVGYIFDLPQND
ncbi:MAG: hypothetical protein DLM61_04350 [Pseudonocardiales bacterium]|nr:MAG: hypothetical protein DLM61_04350 [Pseudonocardiales bacterium]